MLLLIDNMDSFTHNLARYFVELGEDVHIIDNNTHTLAQIEQLKPQKLVISPGPCTPNQAGISISAINYFSGKLPILGVCLGHQAIGQAFGGKVVNAKEIQHGKVKTLFQNEKSPLFAGLPEQFNVTRYHSLVLDEASLPHCFSIDAWCLTTCNEKEIMAISHSTKPLWGVQFHPESLLTEYGHALLHNFLNQSDKFLQEKSISSKSLTDGLQLKQ